MTSLAVENQEGLVLVISDLLPYCSEPYTKLPCRVYGDVKQISSRSTDHYICLPIFAGIALKRELKLALFFPVSI